MFCSNLGKFANLGRKGLSEPNKYLSYSSTQTDDERILSHRLLRWPQITGVYLLFLITDRTLSLWEGNVFSRV